MERWRGRVALVTGASVGIGAAVAVELVRVGGHKVFPIADVHFYMATKFAVTALTEGLRQELRAENTHIRATSLSPGLVDTEFASRLHSDNLDKAAALYTTFTPLETKDIVNAITYVLSAPPHVQIGDIHFEAV